MSRRKLLLSAINANIIPNNQIWYTTSDNTTTYIELERSDLVITSNIYENGIGKITFSTEVTNIPDDAFRENIKITSVILPNSIISIGIASFEEAINLKSVKMQEGIEEIKGAAFNGCQALEYIVLPDSLQYIRNYAFSGSSISYIYIPNNVSSIGQGAFKDCKYLKKVTLNNNITVLEKEIFSGCYSIESIHLPTSLLEIKDSAFFNCQSLRTIYLPESIEKIGIKVFGQCYNLYKFEGKFSSADGKYLIVPSDEGNKLVSYAAEYYPSDKTYRISEGVNIIGEYAFYDLWYRIKNIVLPESVTKVEDYAFYSDYTYSHALNITINSNIDATTNSFSTFAFDEVVFEENATEIKTDLFINNNKIKKVIIGEQVEKIGNRAFKNINDNAVIVFKGNNPPVLGEEVFDDIDNLIIEVPTGAVINYVSSEGYKKYQSKIKGIANVSDEYKITYTGELDDTIYPEGQDNVIYHQRGVIVFSKIVETIPEGKFRNQKNLKSIKLPLGISSIGNGAFAGCSSLEGNFNMIPEQVSTIGEEAFLGCVKLSNINIPNSVSIIGDNAFNTYEKLIVKNFRQSPPTIYDSTFDINNTEIWILKSKYSNYIDAEIWKDHEDHFIAMDSKGNRVQKENELWYKTTDNKKLELSFSKYKKHTFEDGIGIIEFNTNINTLPNVLFYDCKTLYNISIPNGVTEIGNSTFYGCASLSFEEETEAEITRGLPVIPVNPNKPLNPGEGIETNTPSKSINVKLPESITTIKPAAFYNCKSIKNIDLPNLITIENNAFFGCEDLESINYSKEIDSLGTYAFEGCKSLKSITIFDNIDYLPLGIFKDCESLEEINLDNIKSIASDAFSGCLNIRNINLYTIKSIGFNAFYNTYIEKLYINSIDDWCVTTFGNYYSNPMCGGAKLYNKEGKLLNGTDISINKEVSQFAFIGMVFNTLTFVKSIKINSKAFIKCEIKTIQIGDDNTIEIDSFVDTNAEKTIINVKDLPAYITSNSSIDLPGKKTIIHNSIKDNKLIIPNGVESIGGFSFYNSNIEKIDISESVRYIGAFAFAECNLTTVKCRPTTPPNVGISIFGDKDKLSKKLKIGIPTNYYVNADGWKTYVDFFTVLMD